MTLLVWNNVYMINYANICKEYVDNLQYVIQIENYRNHLINKCRGARIVDFSRTMNLSYSGPKLDMY